MVDGAEEGAPVGLALSVAQRFTRIKQARVEPLVVARQKTVVVRKGFHGLHCAAQRPG